MSAQASTPAAAAGPNRPRRSALPQRTLAGFLAAVLAILVIDVLSYRTFQSRTEGGERVTQTLELLRTLEGILSTIKDAETGQRGYILTLEKPYLEPFHTATEALPGELATARRRVGIDPDQAHRLDQLEHLTQQKMAELDRTVATAAAGHRDQAIDEIRTGLGRDLMERIRATVAEMHDSELAKVEIRTRQWEEVSYRSALVTWGGSAVLLFVLVAAAIFSGREFGEQQRQAWLRSGQNELSRVMQGSPDLGTLASRIVALLARYTEGQVGALYAAERSGQMRRVGGYALPDDADPQEVPGLTREALKSISIVSVSDVPESYFAVRSGVGRAKPGQLLLAPTNVDGVPNGVIELGFFRRTSQDEVELLQRVAEPIGQALRACKYRDDLRELLEETQRQAEELQTQQEELRVQNEELEEQTRALQQSREQLQDQQAELEEVNVQLQAQTAELERQRDDLAVTEADLQRANVYKSEFLANMSHELRTPLNSSLILAKLLLDNREGNLTSEQVQFAHTIYSAGNDLLVLINDILDLSKIEAGKLDVRPESIPVARIVDELLATFRPVARERRLELTMSIEEGAPPAIRTDPTRLLQILKNLLSNALKFTEQGGVALRVRRVDDRLLAFDVKDTGIGIPGEQHEVIFEAFRQADGTTNRKYGGTGLGLSISRDLARLLGGELTLESAPGHGSTFTLRLPVSHLPEEDAAPASEASASSPRLAPSRPVQGAGANGEDGKATAAKVLAATAHIADDREFVGPQSRSILVIEDDLRFARIIHDLAHELDFLALIAPTAEEGLALAERHLPSAIVLDVGLPDRSGLSVLDVLKHRPTTRHIPVHMISVADHARAALEMGAAGYAIKPVLREQLVAALKRLEAKFTQKLRRVLVVEDDEGLRSSTCQLLAADDVETVAVGTAAAALEQLRISTFDCMVLDLSLPDRTGFDLLEEMSQKEQYSFPPVIVYTGRSLSREEEQRLRRYSSSIIIKGARSPERLLDEVTLFIHQVESKLPPDRQRMLRDARHRESVFEGRRILVVEDDVRNIFALSSVLEPKGAKVEIARNGREALTHVREKPGVDLVLMDIMMPDMDGLEATRELRKMPELGSLPIIALTAKAMSDDRDQCLAAGANDYIAKPLDLDKLLSLVRVWMPK